MKMINVNVGRVYHAEEIEYFLLEIKIVKRIVNK